ncbi:hypothetical protein Q8A67_006101 [Cirrhinus molitorella]|uniref:Uncharacterized protein n=1 Tax=Cirrhinus molitorella TaxID=172907 RepID=A0AA88Q1J2_9TELE|nr:hypothetical protein Q8A67_006101 [Cirrhinus molitorella]
MYHIVSFVDTEEVDVVPATWVKNGVCLWPPYKDEEVQRATKCLEQPQESWSAYKVQIMYTANNYSEALKELPLAEQQIDLQSEAEPDSPRPPKQQIKRNRCLLDDYDSDEVATTPLQNNLPQAPQIQPLFKRICSASNELQPSPPGQNYPSVWHQNSPDGTQVAETTGPSLLEMSPASEWHIKTLPPPSSSRDSQDIIERNSEWTWPQDATVQSPDHETPKPQRKSLSSCDPFIASLLHEILMKRDSYGAAEEYYKDGARSQSQQCS